MPANGGHRPGEAAGRADHARIERNKQRTRGLVGAPGSHPPLPLRGLRNQKVFDHGSPHRKAGAMTNPFPLSLRPLPPGVMGVRARWRRRRARAHVMNELLAAMDSPSRLDREDWASASRPVTRCTDPSAARPAVWATANESAVVTDTDHTRRSVISTCRCDELHRNR